MMRKMYQEFELELLLVEEDVLTMSYEENSTDDIFNDKPQDGGEW